MSRPEPPADGPLDDVDLSLLDDIRDLFQDVDPMPADLPERIRFFLSLRDLEIEMAHLAEENLSAAGARGIDPNQDGTVRVDGWLAPPQRRVIEIKTAAEPLTISSDEQGRFAFARVPKGTAQLIVRPAMPEQGGAGPSVVTPALIL